MALVKVGCGWMSEQSRVRAKAVELWWGREWLSVWERKGSVGIGSPLSALGASGVGVVCVFN